MTITEVYLQSTISSLNYNSTPGSTSYQDYNSTSTFVNTPYYSSTPSSTINPDYVSTPIDSTNIPHNSTQFSSNISPVSSNPQDYNRMPYSSNTTEFYNTLYSTSTQIIKSSPYLTRIPDYNISQINSTLNNTNKLNTSYTTDFNDMSYSKISENDITTYPTYTPDYTNTPDIKKPTDNKPIVTQGFNNLDNVDETDNAFYLQSDFENYYGNASVFEPILLKALRLCPQIQFCKLNVGDYVENDLDVDSLVEQNKNLSVLNSNMTGLSSTCCSACSCLPSCIEMNNCCTDAFFGNQSYSTCRPTVHTVDTGLQTMNFNPELQNLSYYTIDDCIEYGQSSVDQLLFDNVVRVSVENRIYVNKICALSHGEKDFVRYQIIS